MFEPKITKGGWGIDKSCKDSLYIGPLRKDGKVNEIVSIIDSCQQYRPDTIKEQVNNAKAISAVPELLEVYKAAKKVNDVRVDCMEDACNYAREELFEAIKTLDDRHCENPDLLNNETID